MELQVITLTESATTKVDELIKDEGEENLALRVAVRPGGCSGFSYEMYFDSDIADDDETISFGPIRVLSTHLVQCFSRAPRLITKTVLISLGSALITQMLKRPADADKASAD